MTRHSNTLHYLAGHKNLFDRITKDNRGGRVAWSQRMPKDYDNKACLPWSDVKGHYWYPWK